MGTATEPETRGDRLTPPQWKAVEAEEARVCIHAGPGSGKTRVLVERVAHRVRHRGLALSRMLALTFTENAAAEMKARLARRFAEEGVAGRREVQQAAISTIHSFCARLLRECAVEAGVDPRFRVLEEVEAAELRARSLDAVLARRWAQDSEAAEEFLGRFQSGAAGPLLRVYEEILSQGGDPRHVDVQPAHADQVAAKIYEAIAAISRPWPWQAGVLGGVRRVMEMAMRVPRTLDALPAALRALREAQAAISLRGADREKQTLRELRGNRGDVKELGAIPPASLGVLKAALVEEAAAEHLQTIAAVLRELDQEYGGRKERLAGLDFDDLERAALRLLENPEIAARAAARYREILVDEYQDTSRHQAAILERLAAGAFFVVGDPRQSIYAFRNADPDNFARAQAAADRVLPLDEDFRSRPEIVAAVNAYFTGPLFPPLEARESFDAVDRPAVIVHAATADEEGQGRAQEARSLAALLRETIDSGGWRVTNREAADYGRRLGYGDAALLFRSTTDMGVYEHALRESGVPYFTETGRGFYDAREVADVVNCLRILDNERDEVALAAVLRSPMFGLSDDALYALAAAAREGGSSLAAALAAPPALEPADAAAVARFRAIFTKLRAVAPWRPLDSLIREVVAATDYRAILLLLRDGRRRAANLDKLAALAGSGLAAMGVDSPGELARMIDHLRAGEVRESEAPVPGLRGMVRLMTMHAAKGLEFPVVVLPDLGRGRGGDSAEIDYHPDFGIGCQFRFEAREDPEPSLSFLKIRRAKQERDDAEAERVLFVAMTRARELLVLSAAGSRNKDGTIGHIKRLQEITAAFGLPPLRAESRRFTAMAGGRRPFQVEVRTVAGPLQEVAMRRPSVAELRLAGLRPSGAGLQPALPDETAGAPPDSADFAAAVTDVVEFASCPRRYYLGRYLGWSDWRRPAGRASEEDAEPAELTAAARGSLVHKFLAGAVSEAPADIVEIAGRFWSSDLGRRVKAAADVKKELSVLGMVEGRFLRATVDALAGPLLVDYKTGAPDTAKYRLQMLLYALLTGAREAWIYYLDHDRAEPIEITPPALEEARSAAGRFFAAQQALDFPVAVADHCWSCPFSRHECPEPGGNGDNHQDTTAPRTLL
jgi:ATP-dependent exoDNAse (exonuclease V) beta subunit